jgi:hypothetical protein
MRVQILRTDGREEELEVPLADFGARIGEAIDATTISPVNLRDGRVMFVDDLGYETDTVEHHPGYFELRPVRARKPVNEKATKLYWKTCKPGTTHKIVGDCAIVWDHDME